MPTTLAATTGEDDGFREINLSGKQMFFLFMAATTVLVVAFMLGMLVGRGVRAEREDIASAETLSPPAPSERTTPSTPDDADPRKAAPPAPAENGDSDAKSANATDANEEPPVAVNRNGQEKRTEPAKVADAAASKPADSAKTTAPITKVPEATVSKPSASEAARNTIAARKTAEAAPVAAPAKAPAAPPAPRPEPPAAAASADRTGFAVQVAAVNARGEADAIARRLSGKGYPAYVEVPKGTASTFRVRVGTYPTRHEAQDIADKLKKDENVKPWVTR